MGPCEIVSLAVARKTGGRKGKENVLGFDIEKINDDELERNPASVDGVEFPLGTFPRSVHRNRVDLTIQSERSLHRDIHDHQALGAELERQNLDSVRDQETGPG